MRTRATSKRSDLAWNFPKSLTSFLDLDNLEARRHVNRLCLSANVPLVESGTTGYKGQVTVHVRGKYCACFECAPSRYRSRFRFVR